MSVAELRAKLLEKPETSNVQTSNVQRQKPKEPEEKQEPDTDKRQEPQIVYRDIPQTDPRHKQAYAFYKSGKHPEDIATQFGVSVRTIFRWLDAYREATREALEQSDPLNLITEQIQKYENIEREALLSARITTSERSRGRYLKLALDSAKAKTHLLLDVGLVPKDPTRIYSLIQNLHFLRNRLTLCGQGDQVFGQLDDFSWQLPGGGDG